MPKIPENTNTTEFILESRSVPNLIERGYLGASTIGADCWRQIYYGFHFASPRKDLPIRVSRIFSVGHREEKVVIDELKYAGLEVFQIFGDREVEMTGEVGESQEHIVDFAGHVIGHPDGRVRGLAESSAVHLLEIKTAKQEKFKKYVKDGVEETNNVYYGQVQWLMHMMKLTRALFIMTNKNTSERYYERIKYNKDDAVSLVNKSVVIVTSDEPPEKISPSKHSMSCKFCGARDICHNGAEPVKNCRTCKNSDICDDGVWECGLNESPLSLQEQIAGCDQYVKGWGL